MMVFNQPKVSRKGSRDLGDFALERARYIERETTSSGLQEHRNTNESTEKALEH
jgi:hypothetical protein